MVPEQLNRKGEVVGQRYELLEIIGSGGQSVVYKALDYVDGDHVALKVLESTDPDACERMFREAHIMTQLMGTSAVRILHQCKTYDGLQALVMELLEGKNLADALDLLARAKQAVSPGWLFEVLDPIVSTLEYAHDRGIVHRDLKAENVYLLDPARGGGVRLLDFGFSRLERSPSITAQEMIAGSPAYVAPEVWREGSRQAGRSVDVYALGVLVFRMLGGKLPFPGTTVEMMRGATAAPRPSLHALRPDLPRDVDHWIQQVLAIKPEERFQRCGAAWNALRAVLRT